MPFDRVAFLPAHASVALIDAMQHSQPGSKLNAIVLASRGMQWSIASACDAASEAPVVAIGWMSINAWMHGFAMGMALGCETNEAAAELIERAQPTPDQMACVTSLLERMGRSK